ncbi:PDPFL protein, partial [Psilopogon haemacephalus]|nr:PDPFL protein [Psilopogon haemacephalus]
MASVPSAGCLLAKNQYYRSNISWYCSLLSNSLVVSPVAQPVSNGVGFLSLLAGLPDIIDKYWWIKSFFHGEPSPPAVGRKALSAS